MALHSTNSDCLRIDLPNLAAGRLRLRRFTGHQQVMIIQRQSTWKRNIKTLALLDHIHQYKFLLQATLYSPQDERTISTDNRQLSAPEPSSACFWWGAILTNEHRRVTYTADCHHSRTAPISFTSKVSSRLLTVSYLFRTL